MVRFIEVSKYFLSIETINYIVAYSLYWMSS